MLSQPCVLRTTSEVVQNYSRWKSRRRQRVKKWRKMTMWFQEWNLRRDISRFTKVSHKVNFRSQLSFITFHSIFFMRDSLIVMMTSVLNHVMPQWGRCFSAITTDFRETRILFNITFSIRKTRLSASTNTQEDWEKSTNLSLSSLVIESDPSSSSQVFSFSKHFRRRVINLSHKEVRLYQKNLIAAQNEIWELLDTLDKTC